MSPERLPRDLSARQVRKALERAGFSFQRQKGSHMLMAREDPPLCVVVPDHKVIRLGTLRKFHS